MIKSVTILAEIVLKLKMTTSFPCFLQTMAYTQLGFFISDKILDQENQSAFSQTLTSYFEGFIVAIAPRNGGRSCR